MSIPTGLTDTMIQAFSWMLVHSLWQGLLLALIAGIILMLTKKANAAIRYNLLLSLFSVFLLTAACTFFYECGNIHPDGLPYQLSNNLQKLNSNKGIALPSSNIVIAATVSQGYLSVNQLKAFVKNFSDYFSAHSFLIVMLWFIFFMAKSMSLAGNMLYMHRARHYRVYAPADHWKERVASLCEKLQLKRAVLLLESGYIKIPVVIGYFKPVILMPVGFITGIPVAQVEAVLLHELAHIRRNDYAVNFMQSIAEAIFFFNPGLLWVSSLLREERENCCDDMAIAQTNNKEAFVQALISFKDYSVSMPAYTVAFSGQKSSLLNRVMRIVYQENKTLSIKENGIFIIGIAMLVLTAFTVYPVKDVKLIKEHSSISKDSNSNFGQPLKKPVNDINMAPPGSGTNKLTVAGALADTIGLIKAPVADKIADETTMPAPQAEAAADKMPVLKKDTVPANEDMSEMPGAQLKKLIADAKFDDRKFYSRAVLDGGYYDMVRIRLTSGGGGMTTLRHNGKVAFIIKGVVHEESEVANYTQSQIDAIDNGSMSIGSTGDAKDNFPGIDLSKYDAYVAIGGDFSIVKVDHNAALISRLNAKPNSAIDTLLKSMPGIKINANGTISHGNNTITHIKLNGKSYPVEEAKAAIQHLPADANSQLQVKDTPDDNSKTQVTNAITKPDSSAGNKRGGAGIRYGP